MRKSNAGLEWVEWFTKEWDSVRTMLIVLMHFEHADCSTEEEPGSAVEKP